MKSLLASAAVWLKKNKKIVLASLMTLVVVGVFVLANSVLAQTGDEYSNTEETDTTQTKSDTTGGEKPISSFLSVVISTVCSWITWALGLILGILMQIVIAVAQYNDFINSGAVTNGWVIIRDICNMFFILILLVIAFSVILRIDGYDIKKMIPKLLIMAVLINFSKTICGLIIDAAQVIMMTFVTSFKGVGGPSMVEMFGMKNYLTFNKDSDVKEVKDLSASVAIGYVVAIVFLMISIVVVLALLCVLVMRMIMLWIYVVLSPLAFFLASFPQGKSYSQRWWKEFTENVIVGPVLAFFLWLAFVSLGTDASVSGFDLNSANSPAGPTEAFKADNILKYVISIGMLLGGLIISQSMAGAAGGMAGKAMGKIQGGAGWVKKKTLGGVKTAGLAVGGAAVAGGKAGLGFADRLGGRVVGAGLNLAAKKMGTKGKIGAVGRGMVSVGAALGTGGLMATPLMALKNAPGNVLNKIRGGSAEKKQLEKDIARGTTSPDGSFEHKGARYKWHDKENAYQQVDENGVFKPVAAGTKLQYKGEDVKKMGGLKAAWVESREAAGSGSRGAANAAQSKKINEEMENIKNSGMGNDEAMKLLNDFSTSAPKKMALAMFLASNKAFKNKAEKDKARSVLSNNSVLSAKFDDDVVKNQAHLAYDLEAKRKDGTVDVDLQARERVRFKKDLSKGKVDVNNLSKDAINDHVFQNELRAWAKDPQTGSEEKYARILEKNAENGGGENSKNVADLVKSQIGFDAGGNAVNIKDDASARLLAKLTGDLGSAFGKLDASGTVKFDKDALEAMGKYLSTSSPKELSKIKVNDLKTIAPKGSEAASVIALNMKLTTVKSLNRNAETSDLAGELKGMVDDVAALGDSNRHLNLDEIDRVQVVADKMNKDNELQDI